ncbi:Mpv17/PMP22 protein [Dioscorea alata]|uniref:Mpv17/PMP22 protein n=4 Tax=Dioscorea alata TaxID=55571 RepID=A0ACB7WRW6_DIOAL|nr:Mpv17/PMP22 protein [Dioscorea alata]KAH7690865.1 Mpv17/PMP22 protein [Dioscorea alata]KAH7690866.1 Mpv17/PMP22 protein [Dioscorea alata]KAH7690867.1 Mpv17/PMP22 protein [Dioscorea alata]
MASMLFQTLIGVGAITPPPKCSPILPNSTRNAPISRRNSYSRFGFSVHSRNPLFGAAFSVGFGAMRRGFRAFNAVSSGGSGGDGGFRGWDGNGGSRGGDDEGGDDVFPVFQWYSMALDKHPVLTKSITSALLTLIGDSISQLMIEQASKLDLKRSLIFTTLGFVLVGPTLHFWYLSLSKLVTTPGASGAFVCLLLDQFLFSPIFIGVFLSLVVILEGRPSQVVPKLKQEWPSSMVANWQLWIPFQFLIFRFVPQQFQVLATDFVALAWNAILSFKAHREVVLK